MADSNPFLQRSERSDDVPPAADNPFATPASRAAASAALAATVSAASNPAVQRAAATGSTLVQHGVDSGWSVKVGSVWLPGCCGGESVRVPVRWHLTLVPLDNALVEPGEVVTFEQQPWTEPIECRRANFDESRELCLCVCRFSKAEHQLLLPLWPAKLMLEDEAMGASMLIFKQLLERQGALLRWAQAVER